MKTVQKIASKIAITKLTIFIVEVKLGFRIGIAIIKAISCRVK
jgi:hypothetical protein